MPVLRQSTLCFMRVIPYFSVAWVELDSFGCISDGITILLEFDIGLKIFHVSKEGAEIERIWAI